MNSMKSIYIYIVTTVFLALMVRTFIFGVYKIPTVTMLPNLIPGDVVIGNRILLNYFHQMPKRGEVFSLTLPQKIGQHFIKRVVGLPGEKIEFKEGKLFINDQECSYELVQTILQIDEYQNLNEKCFNQQWKIIKLNSKDFKTENSAAIVLGENEFYVLGDNRDGSEDSRTWGVVKYEQLSSKVERVAFSIGSTQDSIYPEKGFRFSRILTMVE